MADPETDRDVNIPDWMASNQTAALFASFVVLLLYVAPVYLVAGSWWRTDGFQEDSFLLDWFATFMKSADSTLNQFHKVLLPLLTALSIVAFKGPMSRGPYALGAFLLTSFAVSLFVGVVFDMEKTATALTGLETTIDLALTKAFFTRIQESLMTYLMLLFGLRVASRS